MCVCVCVCVWREREVPEEGDICIHIVDSLCCTAETNIILEPDPGIEPEYHALQLDSLPSEPPGKP